MTLYLIGYELIQIVKYSPGTVICPQSKKSELNFKYHQFLNSTFTDLKGSLPKPYFNVAKLEPIHRTPMKRKPPVA